MREVPESPAEGDGATSTPTTAKTACAPVSHLVESRDGLPERRRERGFSSMPASTPAMRMKQRRPDGEGVVLLVGGEEKKNRVQAEKRLEQPDGADAELEAGDVAGDIFADGVVEIEVDGLAGVVAEVLEPVAAGLPGGDRRRRAGRGSRGRARPGGAASTHEPGSLL